MVIGVGIVVCVQNFRALKEICAFYRDLGVDSVRLKIIQAVGKSVQRFRRQSARLSEQTPYVAEAIDYCRKHGMDIQVKNFPICLLPGYPELVKGSANESILFYVKNRHLALEENEDPFSSTNYAECCKACAVRASCYGIADAYVGLWQR